MKKLGFLLLILWLWVVIAGGTFAKEENLDLNRSGHNIARQIKNIIRKDHTRLNDYLFIFNDMINDKDTSLIVKYRLMYVLIELGRIY